MTRFLSLFLLALVCAGCATAPRPAALKPRVQPSPEAARAAAQREMAAIQPAEGAAQLPQTEADKHRALAHLPGQAESAQAEESALQASVTAWFEGLSQGNIQYRIPSPMFWKESSTVTVVVEGPKAAKSAALAQPTGQGTLAVSNQMKVLLSSPGDPDEFLITPANGSTDIQFVPEDGSTTWSWTVTPKYTGAAQNLQVSAWVLYPGNSNSILLELPAYTATVNVNVPGFGTAIKRLLQGDPEYWLKYGLPGGGGFIFVSGIVTWIVKRRGKKKTAP